MKKVAFLGIPGSFTYQAACRFYLGNEVSVPCETISDCINKVSAEKADCAVIPLENSLNGSITETYDQLIDSKLSITGEVILHINHCLLAKKPGIISAVYSNPQAIIQCKNSIARLKIKKSVFTSDTASAAAFVAKDKGNIAAIAGTLSAELYGLKILVKNIEDNPHNFTRFAVVAKNRNTAGNKSTLLFSVAHKPGSLVNALIPYVHLGLNLTRIESRPVYGKPWEYLFILDFESENSEIITELIRLMKKEVTFLRVLGFYKKGEIYET